MNVTLRRKTLRYRFRMTHVPGVRHTAADGVSRHHVSEPTGVHFPDDVATLSHDIIYPPRSLLEINYVRRVYVVSVISGLFGF